MTLRVATIRSDGAPDLLLSASSADDLPLIGRWLAAPHVAR